MGNLNFAIIESKSRFNDLLSQDLVDYNWLVFIEDSREIWTHGLYFGAIELNVSEVERRLSNIETVLGEIGTSEMVKQSHIVLTQDEYNDRLSNGLISDDVFYYITEN